MQPVSTRISEDEEELLAELEDEMSASRAEVLRRLIRRGLAEWRKDRALNEVREQRVTLRKAAESAGLSYVEMLSLAADAGIDIGYSTEEVERDRERI